jgi:hypothetical protein
VHLHEYTGKHPDIQTDARGRASFTIPSNVHLSGQSYLAFSRSGFDAAFQLQPRATSQTFFGADDLHIPALRNGAANVSRVYAGLGSPIRAVLEPNGTAWVPGASIALEIAAPDGGVIASKTIHHGDPTAALVANARQQGWHTLRARASGLAGTAAYELKVTYQGAQHMEESRP